MAPQIWKIKSSTTLVVKKTPKSSFHYFKHKLAPEWPGGSAASFNFSNSTQTTGGPPGGATWYWDTQKIWWNKSVIAGHLCADSENDLDVGWPPDQDQTETRSGIAISNMEDKIQTLMNAQTHHKEELLSALKTLLKDINDWIDQHFRKMEDTMVKHTVYTRNQMASNLNSSSYGAVGKH